MERSYTKRKEEVFNYIIFNMRFEAFMKINDFLGMKSSSLWIQVGTNV
jgi:hypothetical protein